MRTATSKDKMEFAFAMARHSAATLNQVQRLLRFGATHGRLAETECNRQLTDAEIRKQENIQMENIQMDIIAICAELEIEAKFSGDPRGNTVKIAVADGCGYCEKRGNKGWHMRRWSSLSELLEHIFHEHYRGRKGSLIEKVMRSCPLGI
jgi:hypothetical protein